MIGLYGPVIFNTTTSPDALKKTVAARWGVHELWRAKPMLEYAGPSLIELEFKMNLLKPYTTDPLGMVILLEETMDLAIPYPLILGLKPMGRGASLFIMESLEISPTSFFQGGAFMGVSVDVKLKEYPDTLLSTLLAALGGVFGGSGTTAATGATAATGEVQVGQLTQDVSAGAIPTALSGPEADAVSSLSQVSTPTFGIGTGGISPTGFGLGSGGAAPVLGT